MVKGVHPLAELARPLSDSEFAELVAGISEYGQKTAVFVDADGLVLDGRHRLKACEDLGIEPRTEVIAGDPAKFIVSMSGGRRNYSTQQLAAHKAWVFGTAGYRGKNDEGNGYWKRGTLNDASGSTERDALNRAGLVWDYLPDLLPEVERGDVSLNDAYQQATKRRDDARAVEEEKQRMAQEEADAAEWLTTAEPVEGFDRAAYPTAVAAKAAWVGLKMRADQEYENQLATERFLERHLANKAAEAARVRRSLVAQMATALGNVADLRDPEERALIAEGLKEFADDIGPREGGFLAPYFLRNIAEWLTVFAGELEGKTNE